jgi:hypothetical protein
MNERAPYMAIEGYLGTNNPEMAELLTEWSHSLRFRSTGGLIPMMDCCLFHLPFTGRGFYLFLADPYRDLDDAVVRFRELDQWIQDFYRSTTGPMGRDIWAKISFLQARFDSPEEGRALLAFLHATLL